MNPEWRIDKEDVEIDYSQTMGSGEYGNVYRAKWKKANVVVKVFHSLSNENRDWIIQEIQIMTKLHHPNIIQMYGYMKKPLTIVMEYIEGMNLSEFMKETRWIHIRTKKNVCRQIAHGLLYLHQRKPMYIIHRDLKPSNILITKQHKIKIIDFGISKLVKNDSSTEMNEPLFTNNVGTYLYMAPEIYHSSSYTSKVDIYSFGIIMYELYEERRFYIENVRTIQEYKQQIASNVRASWTKYGNWFYKTPYSIRKLVERCWSLFPEDRPTTLELVTYLDY